jgi:hypothetical protein
LSISRLAISIMSGSAFGVLMSPKTDFSEIISFAFRSVVISMPLP